MTLWIVGARPPHEAHAAVHQWDEKSWLCALTGWIVTCVVLHAGRRNLLRALAVGWVVTLSQIIVQYLIVFRDIPPGYRRENLDDSIATANWLFVLAVITLTPAAAGLFAIGSGLLRATRRPRERLQSESVSATAYLLAVVSTVAVCCVFLTGRGDVLAGRPGDGRGTAVMTSQWTAPDIARPHLTTPLSRFKDRTLSVTEATTVVEAAGPALPGWSRTSTEATPLPPASTYSPAACQDSLEVFTSLKAVDRGARTSRPPTR